MRSSLKHTLCLLILTTVSNLGSSPTAWAAAPSTPQLLGRMLDPEQSDVGPFAWQINNAVPDADGEALLVNIDATLCRVTASGVEVLRPSLPGVLYVATQQHVWFKAKDRLVRWDRNTSQLDDFPHDSPLAPQATVVLNPIHEVGTHNGDFVKVIGATPTATFFLTHKPSALWVTDASSTRRLLLNYDRTQAKHAVMASLPGGLVLSVTQPSKCIQAWSYMNSAPLPLTTECLAETETPLVIGNELYFLTANAAYKTDGTVAGTQRLGTVIGNSARLFALNGRVFVYDTQLHEITVSGLFTKPWPSELRPGRHDWAVVGERVFYLAESLPGEQRILSFNGDTVSDAFPLLPDLLVKGLWQVGDQLLVANEDETSYRLAFVSDTAVTPFTAYEAEAQISLRIVDDAMFIPQKVNGQAYRTLISQGGDTFSVDTIVEQQAFVRSEQGWLLATSDRVNSPDGSEELLFVDARTLTRTRMDIFPGSSSSSPRHFTKLNDSWLFTATDALHGREIWITDGTIAGTHLFADVVPGMGDSLPSSFVQRGNFLYFIVQPLGFAPTLQRILLSAVPTVESELVEGPDEAPSPRGEATTPASEPIVGRGSAVRHSGCSAAPQSEGSALNGLGLLAIGITLHLRKRCQLN